MSKSIRQIKDFKKLGILSRNIFDLHEFNQTNVYEKILRYLAYSRNEDGVTIQEITKYLGRIDWHTVKKKFDGTPQTMGLVPLGFVYRINEGKGRGGNEAYSYHLTFKGLLASLSTGIKFEKTSIYKNYVTYLKNFVSIEKVTKLIEQYVKQEIHNFLLIHYLSGITLRKVTNFNYYYRQFFRYPKFYDILYHNFEISSDKIPLEVRRIKNTLKNLEQEISKLRIADDYLPSRIYDDITKQQPAYEIDDPFGSDGTVTVLPEKPETNPLKIKVWDLLRNGLGVLIFEYPVIMERIEKERGNFSFKKYFENYRKPAKQVAKFT